jgi:hypothetical protein
MLHCRLNLGSCSSALRPIIAVGWNIRLEKYESGYQYLQVDVWEKGGFAQKCVASRAA